MLPSSGGAARCSHCGAVDVAAPFGAPPSRATSKSTVALVAGGCGVVSLLGLCLVGALFALVWRSGDDDAPAAVAPVAPSPSPVSASAPEPASPGEIASAPAPVAEPAALPPAHFESIACLLGDANGDGVRELGGLIERGRERRVRLAMIDGAAGTVVWETEPMSDAELRVLCLGDEHLGAVDQRAFELIVVPTRGVEGEVRRTLSDEVDRFGVGRGCVTLRTEDRQTLGVALDDASDTRCAARARARPHIGEEVTTGFVHGIISTIRRPVVAEHEGARYELRTRRPGTPFLEVARASGRERWSRPLSVVPVGGEAIGYLAIAAGPQGPVVVGTQRGAHPFDRSLNVVSLDAATGAERFTTNVEGRDIAGMFYNGRFVIMATRGSLVALDTESGQVAWRL